MERMLFLSKIKLKKGSNREQLSILSCSSDLFDSKYITKVSISLFTSLKSLILVFEMSRGSRRFLRILLERSLTVASLSSDPKLIKDLIERSCTCMYTPILSYP